MASKLFKDKVDWYTPTQQLEFFKEAYRLFQKAGWKIDHFMFKDITESNIFHPCDRHAIPTYYNNNKRHDIISTYDSYYEKPCGYDQKRHRDDRKTSFRSVKTWEEEGNKSIPLLGNSIYGHFQPIDVMDNPNRRRYYLASEIYRKSGLLKHDANGINIRK